MVPTAGYSCRGDRGAVMVRSRIRRWPKPSHAGQWPSRADLERGSGSVVVVTIIAFLAATTAVVLPLVVSPVLRNSLQAAADFAAIGAATAMSQGSATACDLAAEIVGRNEAKVVSCQRFGGTVEVVVMARRVPGILQRWGSWSAVARADDGAS